MKWGQASRRPKKPWHSDDGGGGADGASPSKPWLQDATPKPSVASILGALSFEGAGQDDDVKEINKNSSSPNANVNNNDSSNDINEWQSIEPSNVNNNVDNKSQQGDSVTEDCTESETALETPLSLEDQDKSADTDTMNLEQPLSPTESVYYNAQETEMERELAPTTETEVPILEVQELSSSSSNEEEEVVAAECKKYRNPLIVLPSAPVQSRVQYFSEEWPSIQQQLSHSSSKSSNQLEGLVEEGKVQRQVQTVELTEAQQACKRLAHAAAAAAQKRIAQRDERLASLFVKTNNSFSNEFDPLDYYQNDSTAPDLEMSMEQEPSPTNSSPSNRADQIQSELELGRQRALAALALARQQKPPQPEDDNNDDGEDPTAQTQLQAQRQIHVKSTVLMAGEIKETDNQGAENYVDDDENYSFPPSVALAFEEDLAIESEIADTAAEVMVDDDDVDNKVENILNHELCHSDDAVVQKALQFLVDLTTTSMITSLYKVAPIIQRIYPGIPGIVRAMERHVDSDTVQIIACRLLERLALDTHQEIAIGEAGGVRAILQAMRLHRRSAAVHAAAWAALWNCTCGNACDYLNCIDDDEQCDGDNSMMTLLVSWMRQHAEDAAIQASACGVFANLCVAHSERLQQFIQAGGMQVMAAALQRHWQDEPVRREVTHSMTVLLADASNSIVHEIEDISIVDQVVLVDEHYFDGDEEFIEEEVVDDKHLEECEYEEEVIDDEEETLVEYFEDVGDQVYQLES